MPSSPCFGSGAFFAVFWEWCHLRRVYVTIQTREDDLDIRKSYISFFFFWKCVLIGGEMLEWVGHIGWGSVMIGGELCGWSIAQSKSLHVRSVFFFLYKLTRYFTVFFLLLYNIFSFLFNQVCVFCFYSISLEKVLLGELSDRQGSMTEKYIDFKCLHVFFCVEKRIRWLL